MNSATIEELSEFVGGRVVGDGAVRIESGAALERARSGQISFLANSRYAGLAASSQASAIVVAEPIETAAAQIVVRNPYYAFTRILVRLHGHRRHPDPDPEAHPRVHPSASVDPSARLHAFVTIGERARVGPRTVLYPGVAIGADSAVGADCVLYPNVVLYDGVRLGDRVIVHAGTAVGQDGLGFSTEEGVHHKIPHLAGVIVEDDVEIGANSSIERGTLVETVIGRGSKLGGQLAIGHGVQVGPHCLMVAQTGIAGSTKLGHHCVLAGQTGIAGHLEIGNQVTVAAQSGVHQNIPDGQRVFGTPAFDMELAVEAYALIKRLPALRKQVKTLEARLARLEAKIAT